MTKVGEVGSEGGGGVFGKIFGGGGKKAGASTQAGGLKPKPASSVVAAPDIYARLGITRQAEQKAINTAYTNITGGLTPLEAMCRGAVAGEFHGQEHVYTPPKDVQHKLATARRVEDLRQELKRVGE